jgi:hypothetical protein
MRCAIFSSGRYRGQPDSPRYPPNISRPARISGAGLPFRTASGKTPPRPRLFDTSAIYTIRFIFAIFRTTFIYRGAHSLHHLEADNLIAYGHQWLEVQSRVSDANISHNALQQPNRHYREQRTIVRPQSTRIGLRAHRSQTHQGTASESQSAAGARWMRGRLRAILLRTKVTHAIRDSQGIR